MQKGNKTVLTFFSKKNNFLLKYFFQFNTNVYIFLKNTKIYNCNNLRPLQMNDKYDNFNKLKKNLTFK